MNKIGKGIIEKMDIGNKDIWKIYPSYFLTLPL